MARHFRTLSSFDCGRGLASIWRHWLDSPRRAADNHSMLIPGRVKDGAVVIETNLGAEPPEQAGGWKALEKRIAGSGPTNGEPEIRMDEDGYLLPNAKTVAVTLEIAARLREAGTGVPLRLGQTANGGINFEWRSGNRTERLTVNARGETELARFEDSKLVSRKPIRIGTAHQ